MRGKMIIVSVCVLAAISSSLILLDMFWQPPSPKVKLVSEVETQPQTPESKILIDSNVVARSELVERKDPAAEERETLQLESDQNNPRVSKIHSLVTTALGEDKKRLQALEVKRQKIVVLLEKIQHQSAHLNGRIKKLGVISSVLDESRDSGRNIANNEVPEPGVTVDTYNKMFAHKMAKLQERGKTTDLTLNGSSLLLIDSQRPRVSELVARKLVPIVESLKNKDRLIDNITLKPSESTPKIYIDVVRSYLKRQFGWTPVVEINNDRTTIDFDIVISAKENRAGL